MRLEAETWVTTPRNQVFAFFADARNLQALTPPWLFFTIRTPGPIDMRVGALIDYQIRLRGIPMRWRTLISAYEPPQRFVDEQIKGPYRRWVHTHEFEELRGGTTIRDRVEFDMIGSWLVGGWIARDLKKIFGYRHQALLTQFDQAKPWAEPDIRILR